MLLRIRREIFRAGEFETHEIENLSFREDICREFHLDIDNTVFYDDTGCLIKEDAFVGYTQITAVQKPAELTTVALVASAVALVAGAAVIGYSLYWQKHGNQAKITYSNSLRGAQNPMRKGGPVGILLGNYRVPLDMAGLVYSSVENDKQFIHELFCAGYRPTASNSYCGVLLRTDDSQAGGALVYGGDGNPNNYKAWIGDTPFGAVAKSIKISASDDKTDPDILKFPYYNRRCIEDSLALKLLNGDTSRGGSTENILVYQAPSGCYRIGVCMCAPYGYYELDDHGNQAGSLMNYHIQVREVGTEAWTSVYRICQNMNVNEYRRLHYYTLTNLSGFSIDKRYEVRIWMDDGRAWNGNDASHNTTMTVEFIQYDTANIAKYPNDTDYKAPVYNSQQYALVDMKAQATDKLTGYINQFYVECYLQCRAYHATAGTVGTGEQSHWYVPSSALPVATRIEMMSNPASVLLYVLTNKNVNPRALTWAEAADKIDWIAFRDWYLFCAEKHWTCNAWITDQMMIGQLCDLICSTGRAVFRTVNGKYSVLLACENNVVTQMFTPRNAWDMQMNKSFEKPLDAVKAEFVDEGTWTEAERTAYVDESNTVVIDEDITDIEDQLTIETFSIWGVTRPQQIADLEAYQLLQRRLQVRSYAWKCSLEGLMCSVGDVVYMANENFLYSLGYGRIKGLKTEDGYVKGVYVDESLSMESGRSYGITVRQNDGTFTTYPISSLSTSSDTFDKGVLCTLATPVLASSAAFEEGNLFMYGDANVAGKKLLITNIQYDSDRNASIEAVDYIPEIFQSLDSESWDVPDYVSGISKYGSGASFAKGAVPAVINNPPSSVHMTNVDIEGQIQGIRYDIEYGLSTSPVTPPSDMPSVFGYSDSDSYGAHDSSDSEDFEYGFPDVYDWGTNFDKWYKGLYVWQRMKVTDVAGNITYTDPIYCKEITESLINGCSLNILLDNSTWEKNLSANPDNTVTVLFSVVAKSLGSVDDLAYALAAGGGVVLTPYKRGNSLGNIPVPEPIARTHRSDNTVTYDYAVSFMRALDADCIAINVSIRDTYIVPNVSPVEYYTIDTESTAEMTSVDVTVADPFGGMFPMVRDDVTGTTYEDKIAAADALAEESFTSKYDGVAEGATYSLNISGDNLLALRTYTSEGWVFLASTGFELSRISALCAKAQKAVLANVEEGTVTATDFGYFNVVIAKIVTASFIGSKQIELQADSSGNPGMVYGGNVDLSQPVGSKTTGAGFYLDSDGNAEVSNIHIRGNSIIEGDSTVEGLINNRAENGDVVFATNKDSGVAYSMAASKTDGTDTPKAYKHYEWKEAIKSLLSNIGADVTLSITGTITGTLNGVWGPIALSGCRRVTSIPTGSQNVRVTSASPSSDSTKVAFENNEGKIVVVSSIHIAASATWNIFGTTDYGDSRIIVRTSTGEVYKDYGLNDDQASAYYYNITVPKGGYIEAFWGRSDRYSYRNQRGFVDVGYFSNLGWNKLGIWLVDTEGNAAHIDDIIPNDGYGTTAQLINRGSRIAASITFTADATWPDGVVKYYDNFSYSTPPSDSSGNPPIGTITTVMLDSSSTFTYGGQNKQIMRIQFSTTALSITCTDSNTYVLSSGYHPSYSVSLLTVGDILGARSQSLMPVYANGSIVGAGYVGTVDEPWNQVYADVVTQTSKRERKTNITEYMGDALAVIKQVCVKSFNYKSEIGKDRCYTHIGFIADETPEELATPYHDVMDEGSCIGILIKAVQELIHEVERLKHDKET